MENMHIDVATRSSGNRELDVAAHNWKTNVRPISFTTGDFVLRGLRHHERGQKPSLKWEGPFRVESCISDYIFNIETIISGKKEKSHGRRLKLFRNRNFEVTEELVNQLSYQEGKLLFIEDFIGIRKLQVVIEIRVQWKGFKEDETDWVSVKTLREDVPVMLEKYLQDLCGKGTPRQRKIEASI